MRRVAAVLRELYGLVVDDGTLALATLVWTGIVWLLVAWAHVPGLWSGLLLFAGLAVVLTENLLRRAGR